MSTAQASAPLWQLLQHTATCVQAVAAGQSLTALVQAQDPGVRAGVQALSFQVMRQWGCAQALRALLAPRRPAPRADALLCSALALVCDERHTPYPEHTLVSQAVEAARRQRGAQAQAQAAFINACLRRFLREKKTLLAQVQQDEQARWNHPNWWVQCLRSEHPQHWQSLLTQAQHPAPMTLRVNLQRGTVEQYQQRLLAAGMPMGQAVGPCGLQLQQAVAVQHLPGFAQGDVSVQDAAAQLAAPLLLDGLTHKPGLRVLDACAAPGGKTGHLLELHPDAQVLALDIDAQRCQKIVDNLQRLALSERAQVRQADALVLPQWWDGQPFDAVLLDAPCTASGIGRRHPDVRWLRREQDSAQLAQIQMQMLQRLWSVLAVGGRLLYCTCSVFRSEGQAQIDAFVRHTPSARRLPAPGHLLPGQHIEHAPLGDNGLGEHDWFYYALLEKDAQHA